jgi:hypothetical protein
MDPAQHSFTGRNVSRGRLRETTGMSRTCRSCGPNFYSIKITENVRKFAAEQKLLEDRALQPGLEQKACEFVEAGAEKA